MLAAILLQASAAVFSPPLEIPLRVVSERREAGRVYRLERTLRFKRESDGYRAEVALRAASAEGSDSSGTLFEGGFVSLIGTPIVVHLDRAGAVTGIDDLDALWVRFARRVADLAAERRALAPASRVRLAGRILAPLQAIPVEKRRALLATLVTAAIADEDVAPGTSPIRLPASSPFGGAAPLDGVRTVTPQPGGLVRSVTRAASAAATLKRTIDIDPATGLITRNVKTLNTRAGATETAITTLVTVDRAP